ncbi:MAG: hypothetical protein AAFW60_01860 [Pseudomonadota bacterium]
MWVKLEGIKAYTRRGKVYAYCRLTGKRLKNAPQKRAGGWYGDAKLVAELNTIREKLPAAGSIRAMIADYKEHDVSVAGRKAFCDLAARTQADYVQDFDRLCAATIGEERIANLSPAEITIDDCRALRDGWSRKHGATQTKRIMAACSVLWSYGLEYGWVATNLWRALPAPVRAAGKKQANPPWYPWELMTMIGTAPHIGLARAYALIFCGVRPENTPSITLHDLRDSVHAQKTGAEHFIEMPDELLDLFEGDQLSIMATNQENGRPWRTYGQLRLQFNRHRDQLSADGTIRPGLTLKGLNHTLGSALAESGASQKEMEAAMARSAQTVAHYSRRADKKLLSRVAFQRLPAWFNLSNGDDDVSNG